MAQPGPFRAEDWPTRTMRSEAVPRCRTPASAPPGGALRVSGSEPRKGWKLGADRSRRLLVPPLALKVADAAADLLPGPYLRARDTLDRHLAADVHRRVAAAGHLPELAGFDTIRGVAGYGAYSLRYQDSFAVLRPSGRG
ncbi:hypothetical protein [Streptomyces sp. NBC_01236]|uniref:hypothetical protein n=1 Tax=Streptomyces sp. NBC_01236 TaxID=2903789 RepID=UPI003FA3532C